MIQIENISKVFRTSEVETVALNHVNLEVKEGEFVAIMGPSGCGKSTLLNILGLLDNPTEGSYQLMGQEVAGLKEKERTHMRKGKLGFVFQSFNLLPKQTALDNVALPLGYAGYSVKQRKQIAFQALKRVGLEERVNFRPSQLSGGQQQRVAIARALVNNPKIILADEPVASLDPITTQKIMGDLKQINQTMGKTVIVNIHSVQLAKEFSSRILGFKSGQVVFDGTPEELTGEELTRIYGRNILEEKEGAEHEA